MNHDLIWFFVVFFFTTESERQIEQKQSAIFCYVFLNECFSRLSFIASMKYAHIIFFSRFEIIGFLTIHSHTISVSLSLLPHRLIC